MFFPDNPELNLGVDIFFKLGISIVFVFYIIFAFVIVKQVNKMTDTLEVGMERVLRALAWLHFFAAIAAFFIAFVTL